MTDMDILTLMSQEAVSTIANGLQFIKVKSSDEQRHMRLLHRHSSVPAHVGKARLAGIKTGRELLLEIVSYIGQELGSLSTPVTGADELLAEAWKVGNKSIFARSNGTVLLRRDWRGGNVDVMRKVVDGVIQEAAKGEVLGFVYDLDSIIVSFGEHSDGTVHQSDHVLLTTKGGYDPRSSEVPVQCVMRIEVDGLSGSCYRIIKG